MFCKCFISHVTTVLVADFIAKFQSVPFRGRAQVPIPSGIRQPADRRGNAMFTRCPEICLRVGSQPTGKTFVHIPVSSVRVENRARPMSGQVYCFIPMTTPEAARLHLNNMCNRSFLQTSAFIPDLPLQRPSWLLTNDNITINIYFFTNSRVREWRSTPSASQVLPSSKSCDTKTRKDIKNPTRATLHSVD